ncbi:type I-E CRISPR-associated protein Cas7/Cse4/CasC, partial [Streptomyces sp. MCAF7]
LGEGLREDESPTAGRRVAVEAFLEGFVTSLPTGKINSFGNHTLPATVIVKIRNKRPISFAAAFERPVTQGEAGGFLRGSCERLARHVPELEKAYGVAAPDATWIMRVGEDTESLTGLGTEVTLPELVDAVGAVVAERLEPGA